MSESPSPFPTITYCSEREGWERVQCSDWFFPLVGIVVALLWMIVVISCLSSLIKRGLKPKIASYKKDLFKSRAIKDQHVYGQNWNYDYVLAFNVSDSDSNEDLHTVAARNANQKYVTAHSFINILQMLQNGSLETKSFFSQDKSMVFVKIRAPLERLCLQASLSKYKILLNKDRVKQRLTEGGLFNESTKSFRWKPKLYSSRLMASSRDLSWRACNYVRESSRVEDTFEYMMIREEESGVLNGRGRKPPRSRKVIAKVYPIKDELSLCKYPFNEFHYGPYSDRLAFGKLFHVDKKSNSPFRGVDRIKLILNILKGDEKDGGCHLNIGKLMKTKCIVGAFPLHEEEECIRMQQSFLFTPNTWDMTRDADGIKDYYDTKIGLYFVFITKYSSWLFVASFFGVFSFACVAFESSFVVNKYGTEKTHGSSIIIPLFAVFIMLWSQGFLEDWKRSQIETSMKWGTIGFELNEEERPAFKLNKSNVVINSPVDGKKMYYFPKRTRVWRQSQSFLVILFLVLLVFAGVIAVAIFQAITDPNQCADEVVKDDNFDDKTGFVKGQEYGEPTVRCLDGFWNKLRVGPYYSGVIDIPEVPVGIIIAVIANSIIILIFNSIYGKVSVILNDYENHRTETAYQDSLIFKTAAFQMVNSYGALSYIAFIKEPIVNRISGLEINAICPYVEQTYSEGRSCLNELGVQLFSIFVVNMVVDSLSSICIPFLQVRYYQYKLRVDKKAAVKAKVKAQKKKKKKQQQQQQQVSIESSSESVVSDVGRSTGDVSSDVNANEGGHDDVNNNERVNDVDIEATVDDIDDIDDDDDDDDGDYDANKYDLTYDMHGAHVKKTLRVKSLVELEFDKPEYDALMGPFKDYQYLLIQFGYATIFTAAFPMAPFLAFVNNYCKLRFDLYKQSQLCRRSTPCSAEDIGTWQYVFQLVSTISVISNCALIVFVGGYLHDYQEWLPFPELDSSLSADENGNGSRSVQGYKWLLFFIMEHLILGSKFMIDVLIDDISRDVVIQLERKQMVHSKLIDDAESDEENYDGQTDGGRRGGGGGGGCGVRLNRPFTLSSVVNGTYDEKNDLEVASGASNMESSVHRHFDVDYNVADNYIWPCDDEVTLVE